MTEVTHILETLLDRVRKGELELVPEMVDACLAAGDVLKAQLAHHQAGGPEADEDAVREVCARLEAQSAETVTNVGPDTRYWLESALPPEIAADVSRVDNLLAALAEVASCDVQQRPSTESPQLALWATTNQGEAALREILSFYAFPEDILIQPGGPSAAYGLFDEGESAPAQVSEPAYGLFDDAPGGHASAAGPDSASAYGFFDDAPGAPAAAPAPGAPAAATAQNHGRRASDDSSLAFVRTGRRETDKLAISVTAEASSIRVAVEKVDQLINLVGELVITQAMLAQSASQLDPVQAERLLAGIDLLARNTRDLQEAVMGIRMLPMSMVFSRFPRVVRDVAGELGKQVELRTIGEATELDKGLIEKITDPLTHLVRNSLDHGIETPERRIAAGKPPKGTLTLKAAHQGGSIVIEVMDDGAGLDRNKILAKARERGLPVHDAMSDQEVWQLIYAPGFSTAD